MLSDRVARFIEENALLKKDGRYLVGLSGGADSVTLLLVLKDEGYAVEAVHCNFNLRGEESERDEAFCVELCRQQGISLHRVHFDTRGYASLHKVSIEMAARELRYSYFRRLRRDIGADAICVAHHSDDVVETVLMNLIRGTGLRGLTGIKAVNGDIVRPLLCVSRKDIEQYLTERQQTYVTDSSNLRDDVVRNKLRLDVIPLLQTINPSVGRSISRMAGYLSEAERVVDDALRRSADECFTDGGADGGGTVNTDRLLCQPSPQYTLYYILRRYDFTPSQTDDICSVLRSAEATATGAVYRSTTSQLLFDRDRIIIERLGSTRKVSMLLPATGTYVVNDRLKIRIETTDDVTISRTPDTACMDADGIAFPLTLRTAEPGDRFRPYGMRGSKLVSDYLTDRKRTLFEKQRQLVLTDADGNIVWLVGERVDDRYAVTDSTAAIVRATIIHSDDKGL